MHPFDSISEAEFKLATKLIKDQYSEKPHFITVDRLDPPKKDAIKYLELEKFGAPLPFIARVVFLYFYTANGTAFHKALVNVSHGHVIVDETLPKGVIGPLLPDDMGEIEEVCNTHPEVLAEIEKLKLPKGVHVRNDPWMYGTDDTNDERPLIQCYMYLRYDHTESNHYSLPLKFSPVFEAFTHKLVRIDYLPGGYDETTTPTLPWKQVPAVEYHPDLNGEATRSDLKPLIVQQPEGTSFTVEGSLVQWQDWRFRVASNCREGFALYDVSFKGRSVAYRISLSEMTVPYGDPRAPYHRKQAFDLGDCGFGTTGNSLSLGCDCLGVIKYLDTIRTNADGEPIMINNTVCLHEQDYGILFKHVNYRTSEAVVARRREFVVQTIATVANYEYIINLIFDQVGAIQIQVRATGILSTMPIDDDVVVNFGTNIGPNVMAAYHQHLLAFRIDPAVDGHKNTVVYDDVLPMDEDPVLNPNNVGFYTKRTVLEKSGYVQQSPFTNRAYKIINENVINKVTKKPVAYKIEMPARQMILANPNSWNVRRAKYATQQLWVTKYRDNQLYAAGEFTNQSLKDTGVGEWANGQDSVRNEDVVVWATMGFTHVPRLEDFPVMPVEIHHINIVPFGFFEKNPALSLPLANNSFNKSQYYDETKSASTSGTESASCCNKL